MPARYAAVDPLHVGAADGALRHPLRSDRSSDYPRKARNPSLTPIFYFFATPFLDSKGPLHAGQLTEPFLPTKFAYNQ